MKSINYTIGFSLNGKLQVELVRQCASNLSIRQPFMHATYVLMIESVYNQLRADMDIYSYRYKFRGRYESN